MQPIVVATLMNNETPISLAKIKNKSNLLYVETDASYKVVTLLITVLMLIQIKLRLPNILIFRLDMP